MAARHASVVWHRPPLSSPSDLLVAIQLAMTKRDGDDLVGGGGEEERRCVGRSTGRPSIVQQLMVTVTICLLIG